MNKHENVQAFSDITLIEDDLNVGTVFQHLAEDYVTKVKPD